MPQRSGARSSGSSSSSSAGISRFASLVALALLVLAIASAPARAQTTPAPEPAPDPTAPFFDDSVLQEVRLSINSKDWTTLKEKYLLNDYYPCDFKWGSITVRNIGIRSRGTGSRSGVKPGLRVDFDRYTTNQNFLGLKSFVLRNNTQDQSNLHERVAMKFLRRVGIEAPREAHVKLYVNNVYDGLYTIVESVDKSYLTRVFAQNDGYLYKYDYNVGDVPYYFQYKGSDPALYVPLPFKPETHESDPHPQPIVDMIRTVEEASDAVFRTQISQFIDLTPFIRQVAILQFLGDNDSIVGNYGANNFYMYRYQNTTIHTIIPWDKSEAFRDGPEYPIFHNLYDVPEQTRNRLVIRALAYSDLRNLYLDTLLQCAQSAAEMLTPAAPPPAEPDTRGWLEREIDAEYAQIRTAALLDTTKPYSNDEFEAAYQALKQFAQRRSTFVTIEVTKVRP